MCLVKQGNMCDSLIDNDTVHETESERPSVLREKSQKVNGKQSESRKLKEIRKANGVQ